MRVSKTVSSTTTNFTWDQTGIGNVLSDGNEYVWGLGLISQIASGTPTYAHSDGLGSTRLLTDSSGTVVGTQQPFTFTGEQVDPESGLVYLRNRYLDPSTGRFQTPDPMGFLGCGVNLYAYVGSNPIVGADPSGLDGKAEEGAEAEIGAIGGIDPAKEEDLVSPITKLFGRIFEGSSESTAEAAAATEDAMAVTDCPFAAEGEGRAAPSPIRGGSGEDDTANRPIGKGRSRAANLPTTGRIRYVAPDNVSPTSDLPKANSPRGYGYLDKWGNVWVWDPVKEEWDIQLSREGKTQIGWLSKDGNHVNVAPDGRVTH